MRNNETSLPLALGRIVRLGWGWLSMTSKRGIGAWSDVQYKVAKTVREAASPYACRQRGKGYILAGGTDLLVQMKSGARTPGASSSSRRSPEMVSISEKNGALSSAPRRRPGEEHKKLRKEGLGWTRPST